MENQEHIEKVTWSIEQLDNGITIEDRDALAKEAAVESSAPDEKKNIKRLLGKWLFQELDYAFAQLQTSKVHVTLQFEDALWKLIPPQLASVVFSTTVSATDAASRRPFIIKAPWVPLPLLAMRSSPLFRYLNLWSAKSGTR